jgi:two-component system cell cycle sensor histidine kinase/response regulator CckA
VRLPCAEKTVEEHSKPIASVGVEKGVSKVSTILVVEDEDLLRLAVTKALTKKGFSVIEASDGSAAMELLRAHKDDLDAVLLDVTLPGTSSREIFEEAGRIRSDLEVILTSAYSKETVAATFAGLRVEHFIRKPFHLAELVIVLQEALSD